MNIQGQFVLWLFLNNYFAYKYKRTSSNGKPANNNHLLTTAPVLVI